MKGEERILIDLQENVSLSLSSSLFFSALTLLYSQKLWWFSFFPALNRRLQILYTNEDSKAFLVDSFLT
jgi:hypothetical protein